jgi:DNA-directed RNA polymerase specialized sigma24 family protein
VDARARLEAAVQRVTAADKELAKARTTLRRAIVGARRAGVTYTEIAAAVGVSRQRVKQIVDEETG